jgi:predicted pyridoxine 5'-phosphate oxidase superfamily flavin-nucleotide-binding protein
MKDAVGMRREVNTVEELRAIVGHPASSTTDAQGRVDVSPKGDPPGFVHVIDDTTIAIPERPGNKRVDGYFDAMTVKGKRPILALEIDVEEVSSTAPRRFCAQRRGTRRAGTRRPCPVSRESPRR